MKIQHSCFAHVSSLIASLCLISSVHSADLTWNGSVNNNWNTTDANWGGSVWNNGTPDHAFFSSNTGNITLTEAITAGAVTFGVSNANYAGSFSGAALTVNGNFTAIADGNNGPGGPTLGLSNNVSVSGDFAMGRRVVEITGGTFTANRILSAGSWSRLLISGGSVTATNGIDDSINGGNTMNVFLQGGSLYTPYIKTTTVGFSGLPDDGVVLNGGTLYATANASEFIQSHDPTGGAWGTRNNVGVGTGGANINTNGFNIGINKSMQNYGGAGNLTKNGAGTLTLSAINYYSGGTTVNSGTLLLDGGSGGNSRIRGALTVNSGAVVNFANDDGTGLGWNGDNKVTALTINGGTVSSAGTVHIWNFSGGVNMTGGTLASNNGVSDPNGAQLEWINAHVTTNASSDSSTIAGRIRMRGDGGATGIQFNVADGAAASDLHVSAAITEASGGLGITKSGAGTMRLSGYNTFTGGTTVNGGTLEMHGASGGWGNLRGAVTVNAGATFAITGGDGTGFGWNSPVNALTINGGTFDSVSGAHLGFGGTLNLSLSNGGKIEGSGQWNGGSGVVFSSSGNSTNTINGSWTLRADSGANHAFNVSDGTAGVDLQVNANFGDQYPEVGWVSPSALEKTGAGTMVLAGSNTYNGATIVSAGTLLVTGSLGDSAVSVNGGASFGGTGTVGGSLTINSGGLFHVADIADPLAVMGTINLFAGFGIDDLTGIEWSGVSNGTYTLIEGTLGSGVFAGLSNNSLLTAYDLGAGRLAYLQEGSLQVVVVPETSSVLLSGLGALMLLRRRR